MAALIPDERCVVIANFIFLLLIQMQHAVSETSAATNKVKEPHFPDVKPVLPLISVLREPHVVQVVPVFNVGVGSGNFWTHLSPGNSVQLRCRSQKSATDLTKILAWFRNGQKLQNHSNVEGTLDFLNLLIT